MADRGRPSLWTQEIADEIVSRLSTGEPLAEICRSPGMPAVRTVNDWRASNEVFSANIARARDDGYEAIAADCLAIADETGHDTKYGKNGEPIPDNEWISRSRLRVETRLKLLAKWDPRRYGDKVGIEHSGGTNNTVSLAGLTVEQLEAIAAAGIEAAQK